MQMLDCIIVFVLEELTLSLYELHNYWRYRLHWYTFGEFERDRGQVSVLHPQFF